MVKVPIPTDDAINAMRARLEAKPSRSSIKLSEDLGFPGIFCRDHGVWTEYIKFENGEIRYGVSYNMKIGDVYPAWSHGFITFQYYMHTALMHNTDALTPPENPY